MSRHYTVDGAFQEDRDSTRIGLLPHPSRSSVVRFPRFRHSPRRVLSEGEGPSAFGPYASQEVGHQQMASWDDRQQGDRVCECGPLWGWRGDVHPVYWSVEECL
jgi:hypothetical protein